MMKRGRKSRKQATPISHQEVANAVQQFLKNGGMISKLPDQNYNASSNVGGEKYEAFEAPADLIVN